MKIETILNAMERAYERVDWIAPQPAKFERQYRAFRARILRMFEQYEIYHGFHMGDVMMIETITEKDARIAELGAEVYMLTEDLEKELP